MTGPVIDDPPVELCRPSELIARMRAGDIAVLDALSRCYGQRMLQVGRKRCQDATRAEDAVQDALLSAGEHLADFRGDGSVEGWLLRMVIRACHRMHRGQKNDPQRHAALDPAAPGEAPGPEERAATGEAMQALAHALDALSPRDRALILLTDGEGWSAPELAEALGMTAQAVRTRISRARRQLKALVPAELIARGGA